MRRWTWLVVVAAMSAMALPPPVTAQTSEAVGVVTTMDGRANVARPALTVPLALKFKDDVFGRDRISTQESSLVRVLLGGKAILTVRELSQVTISEEPGRAVVTLPDGKVVLAVAKQRLRPGESIEIRTPNAVAAVRGSSMAVTHVAASADTIAICGSGDCTYQFGTGPTNVLPPGQAGKNAQIVPASPAEMTEAFNVRAAATHNQPDGTVTDLIMNAQMNTATGVAYFANGVAPPNFALGTNTVNPPGTLPPAPNNATTGSKPEDFKNGSTGGSSGGGNGEKGEKIVNGGFEANSLPPNWSLTGAGGIITNLGSITPPEGQRMALIHTGAGAVLVNQLPSPLNLAANRPSNAFNGSVLSQTFSANPSTLYTVKITFNFLSNEFPTFFAGGNSGVNDTFRSYLIDPSGNTLQLAQASLNASFPSGVSPETATAAGFTIFQDNGVTGFNTVTKQWVPEGTGTSTFFADIFNVGDTLVPSGVLVDATSVGQDPPLYFLRRGDSLVRNGTDPLLRLSGMTQQFDSLMAICCEGRARLAGPLLHAIDSNLTVPWSLLAVMQGGVLTTSSTDPLVRLDGGSHTFGGAGVPMFDLYGVNAGVDPETGLTLGTHQPLQHTGSLLETSNATLSAHQAVRVDNALLEATAPLLALRNGSKLTTAADAVQLSYQAKVTSLGSLVKLDRSTMVVASGAALNIAGGSLLRVTGDLFSLTNGSTLSVLRGPLVSLTAGSIMNVTGALIGFGGTGGNLVSVANSLCPCTTIGGLPISLTGGALASNVSIAGAIKNGNLGSLNLAPNSAVIRVDGVGTKVTVNGM
jgi:hypothetical protein